MASLSEADWLKTARTREMRPPMPYFNLQAMTEPDLRAIYRYVRSLPVKGDDAPAYLPPGTEPKTPVVTWPAPPGK